MFSVKFTPQGFKDLEALPKDIQKRVIKKIEFFSSQENPIAFAKPLKSLPPTTHRFRVGHYRVAFYVQKGVMFVHRIRHRSEVYMS